MNLHPASRKEIIHISIGTVCLDVILVAALFLLSRLGIGVFDPVRILAAIFIGSIVAIGNFILLCLTVQRSMDAADQKKIRSGFQLSYQLRMLMQAGWAIAALVLPGIHVLAGTAPLLFPNLTILCMQSAHGRGRA